MPDRQFFVGLLRVGMTGGMCAALMLASSRDAFATPHRVAAHPRRTADAMVDDPARASVPARERAEAATAEPLAKRRGKSRRVVPRAPEPRIADARSAKSTTEVALVPASVVPASATQGARAATVLPVRGTDIASPVSGTNAKGASSTNSTVSKSISEKSSNEVVVADGPRTAEGSPRVLRSANDSLSGTIPPASGSPAASSPTPLSRAELQGALLPQRRDGLADPMLPVGNRLVTVSLDPLVFDHEGDVPRATSALERMKGAFVRCATSDTALLRNDATVYLRFLVRAPGRAEGVDVEKARGVSGDVVRCVSGALSRAYVGAPSDDPVGVSVAIHFRKD